MDHKRVTEQLLHELEGEKGSFILRLRVDLEWDHEHIAQVLRTMVTYITALESNISLERHIARGFWFFTNFVKDWSSHESFRAKNPYPETYYQSVYELIFLLTDWYFSGECPFVEQEAFEQEIARLDTLLQAEES
ncbi:hypothetical protein QE450_001283 [Paenibacillus sp. SORGH_AS306]|uniref:hypothetical protein n=1 Tax=unclassified Paenibacillus TaxID=185978 RepID=UPI00277E3846|nr:MULTISPECIES: hypothetical protein [unclassified Paenibacillus]MDQ1233785.1 hypothetical protein [Paenibacillus sp. SORGH_AS_0306]MDR6110829.1 hypothetical protein [Paenibacillus sp. SORGH_AS_0338]